ncbi:hypothetical protein LUZ63_011384 [Rhynchospora breviuscula]|uniref:Transposase n=1 Tax=Rhynchospora breviuscula TaxID=2022672 RepID=A0A9Q0CIM7_9POAL|nr:hypothetical protein LUZ63_011384 [Rhynchospora breviuscula]
MGVGLHFETQEEIEKIQADAPNDPNNTGQDGEKEPAGEEEGGNPKKRKTRKATAEVWKYFTRGPIDEDGSYYAICKYCGDKAFSLVLDNASSNDTCITELFAKTPILDDLPVDGKTQIPFKKLAWEVPTRWNSTYLMLVLALELKPAICRYINLDKRMSTSPYPFIVQMETEMIAKFDKYWSIGNSLLAIACVLDPRCKLYVVEYYMKELSPQDCGHFIQNLRECMKALFNEYVKENASDQNQASMSKRKHTSVVAGASGSASATNTRAALKDYIKERKNSEPPKSELEDYLAAELDEASMDEEFDILAWWRLKSPKYPILSQLTKDILAVPISTVASEYAFSTSGRILSPARSSLNDESIEALLCEKGENIGEHLWNIDEGGDIEE